MGKKVLLTGGAGFIGSHVADELTNNGYDATILDIVKSPYLKENQKIIIGDICDKKFLFDIVAGMDYVYHFAGIADIKIANEMPYETIKQNILGTTNLIEASLENSVKRFVFASSVYVSSLMGGFYATTKKACEDIIEDYSNKYGLNYTLLRYGTLYGARSNEKNGLYRIVKGLLENESYHYSGSGEEIREFINVIDAAKISVKCLEPEFANRCLTLTGHEKMRIKDLITMIKEMINSKVNVEFLNEKNELHYNITPYNYTPKLGEKIISNQYIDMGQGILEIISQIKCEQGECNENSISITLS